MPYIEFADVVRAYGAGSTLVHALDGASFAVEKGELAVILGQSGAGKTTALNILGGMDRATSGRVVVGGRDVSRATEDELVMYRREDVGFVFQFYNLIPSLTARENVSIVTDIAPQPMAPEQALELVGLGERLDHFPAQLSGGEQQRVAIARAIAKRPVVMLCDEPTGALDSSTGVRVLEALERVNTELGTTTIIITHNADIARMAQRVLWMQDGRIVCEQRNAERLPARELRW